MLKKEFLNDAQRLLSSLIEYKSTHHGESTDEIKVGKMMIDISESILEVIGSCEKSENAEK